MPSHAPAMRHQLKATTKDQKETLATASTSAAPIKATTTTLAAILILLTAVRTAPPVLYNDGRQHPSSVPDSPTTGWHPTTTATGFTDNRLASDDNGIR